MDIVYQMMDGGSIEPQSVNKNWAYKGGNKKKK
jgi:hypothetical protein